MTFNKKLKIISLIVVIVLIAAPVFLKKEKHFIEVSNITSGTGIKSSLVSVKNSDVVYVKCIFKNAGVLRNTINNHGISAVLSYLLFNKINGLTKEETQEKLITLGIAELLVSAFGDDFEISFFVAKENIMDALQFLSYAFTRPTFSNNDLEDAKEKFPYILDEDSSSPGDLMFEKMIGMLFADSIYGMNSTGTAQSISAITIDNIKSFMNEKFTHKNLEIVFAGDISRFDVNSCVDCLFEKISCNGQEYKPEKIAAALSEEKIATINKRDMKDIAGIMSGVRIDELPDIERAAAHIIIKTIFDEKDGDFANGLKSLGITYCVQKSLIRRTQSNIFFITAYVEKKDLENYKKYFYEKMHQYASKINVKDLRKTQDYFVAVSNNGFSDVYDIDEKIRDAALPFEEVTPKIFEKVAKMLFNNANIRTVICVSGEK